MDPSILPFAGALAAALGGYLIAARRTSGKINTTEAKELWDESRSIRDWSQQRIEALDNKILRLEERIDGLFRENTSLAQQVIDLKRTIVEQERTIKDLKDRLEQAYTRIDDLVEQLEKRSDGH